MTTTIKIDGKDVLVEKIDGMLRKTLGEDAWTLDFNPISIAEALKYPLEDKKIVLLVPVK